MFLRRLAWDGVDEDRASLAVGTVRLQNGSDAPAWTRTLERLLAAPAGTVAQGQEVHHLPFEDILKPLVSTACGEVWARVNAPLLLCDEARSAFEIDLTRLLSWTCAPTLHQVFRHTAVLDGAGILPRKEPAQPTGTAQAYERFVEALAGGEFSEVLRSFPVLARILASTVAHWVDASVEFLERLNADIATLERIFNATEPLGRVARLQTGISDRHHGGRSVIGVEFENGRRLAYKPRDLGVDDAFAGLVRWVNARGGFSLRAATILPRTHYGWMEWVEHHQCESAAIGRFYERSGELLCLAYILGAADLHLENLVASGEQPVLIDLETLLHPVIKDLDGCGSAEAVNRDEHFGFSVLSTGLLPTWSPHENSGFRDSSGLGGVNRDDGQTEGVCWELINRDQMTLRKAAVPTASGRHCPSSDPTDQTLLRHTPDLVAGFERMYRFLTQSRDTLLAPGSPLEAFAGCSVRVVFRATRLYANLLKASVAPQVLRNGAEWSLGFEKLYRAMLQGPRRPRLWPIVGAEIRQLEEMDIPRFTADTSGTSLWLGSEEIRSAFAEPPYETVRARLQRLCDEDLVLQCTLIQTSAFTRTSAEIHRIGVEPTNGDDKFPTCGVLSSAELVSEVLLVAEELARRAIRLPDGGVTWVGTRYAVRQRHARVDRVGPGLYEGNSGIAFFFAAVHHLCPDMRWKELALAALAPQIREARKCADGMLPPGWGVGGAFGAGSVLYALARVAGWTDTPDLLSAGARLARGIAAAVPDETEYDVTGGIAGALLGLLAFFAATGDQGALNGATAAGERLLFARTPNTSGLRAWLTLQGNALAGFAHGASGIAYALLRLHGTAPNPELQAAADEAFRYEATLFDPLAANWKDIRQGHSPTHPSPCAWCHGATGIGLARVGGMSQIDTDRVRREIRIAARTTINAAINAPDLLCCGEPGRVEFLLCAGRAMNRQDWTQRALIRAGSMIEHCRLRRSSPGGRDLASPPGLFQGLAGVGYELLRLAHPERFPSVLLWE